MNNERKLRKSTTIIIAVIAALAVLLAVFTMLNRQDIGSGGSGASGTFSVMADGETLKAYSMDDIKRLPHVNVEKNIVSGKHDDESGMFKGVPLENILDDATSGWRDKYIEFIFRAEDGFTSTVFASDIEKGENVLIVYEKDGEALLGKEDGGKGPLRTLIVSDEFGNRSAQMIISVEMKE